MGIASPRAKPNSKTQIKKREEALKNTTKYIACKNCHATNVTLVRGTDSYYCKFCYDKMQNNKNKKKVK